LTKLSHQLGKTPFCSRVGTGVFTQDARLIGGRIVCNPSDRCGIGIFQTLDPESSIVEFLAGLQARRPALTFLADVSSGIIRAAFDTIHSWRFPLLEESHCSFTNYSVTLPQATGYGLSNSAAALHGRGAADHLKHGVIRAQEGIVAAGCNFFDAGDGEHGL
jgi:hypothetical protein